MKIFNKLLYICLILFMILEVKAAGSEKINVTSWDSLKRTIESNKSEIEIELSNSESSNWMANSKITISNNQKITIIANSSITITRSNSFTGTLIDSNGSLFLKTSADNIKFVIDGNRNNIQASGSLIAILKGSANINNVTFQNNNISTHGGAIYVYEADVVVNNSIMTDNEGDFGGAMFISKDKSNITLNNVKILNNKAKTGSGGGIYAYGNLIISGKDTVINGNIAQTYGGGLMIKTKATLNAGKISNNKTITEAGGGIRCDGKLTYNGGVIRNNETATTGGGIDFSYIHSILYKNANEIYNNKAKNSGNDLNPDLKNNVDWTKDKKLNLKKLTPSIYKSYERGVDIVDRTTQGMTVTDKYIVFALYKSDNDKTIIAIADKNTGKLLKQNDGFDFKHANDLTYDSKNGYVYILTTTNKVAKFKINDKYEITDLQYIDCKRTYWAIAYISDYDQFVGLGGRTMYVTNNKFEELYSFDTPTNLMTQGVAYHDNHIYWSATEAGHPNGYQTYYNNTETYSNLIYKYNLNGQLVETLYIPNTTLYGELETCDFLEDNVLLLSYNINLNDKETVTFYKYNVPNISKVKGDVNGDGQVTSLDYIVLRKYIMGSISLTNINKERADINKDNRIDSLDYIGIRKLILER